MLILEIYTEKVIPCQKEGHMHLRLTLQQHKQAYLKDALINTIILNIGLLI